MWERLIPKSQWKFIVHAAPSRNEVVFAGADGSFGRVGAMFMWRDELVIDFLVAHVFFENVACFVI